MAETDPPLLVADHDEGGESEPAAALDDLGDAVDMHELVDKFAVALFPVSHVSNQPVFLVNPAVALKVQTALARRLGQSLDAPMIKIAAPVENHGFDTGGFSPFGDQLADFRRGSHIGSGF